MGARQRALSYLTHPLVVVSIVLLVVNDFVLKGSAPGWLTGKLSDFAGLVFFPGLLALCVGLVAPRSNALYVGVGAWLSTALLFSAVKTVPAANEAFIDAIGLVRGPVQVVRDPTDALAIVVLPLGWWLWSQIKPLPRRTSIRSASAWVAATCAVLATGATSPAERTAVEGFFVDGPRVYAVGRGDAEVSVDDGLTWSPLGAATPETRRLPQDDYGNYSRPAQTARLCHARRPEICYRIVDAAAVEQSRDAGATWARGWTEPASETKRRETVGAGKLGGAASLAFLNTPEPILLVAMGNEGVLRHELDGEWKRVRALRAGPGYVEQGPSPFDYRPLVRTAKVVGIVALVALVLGLVALRVARREPVRFNEGWRPSARPPEPDSDPPNP